jgi:hypothetical protein
MRKMRSVHRILAHFPAKETIWEDLCIAVMIVLKQILKTKFMRLSVGFMWLRMSCEDGNEPLASIKCKKMLASEEG